MWPNDQIYRYIPARAKGYNELLLIECVLRSEQIEKPMFSEKINEISIIIDNNRG